jgi:hypothetical protein
MRLLWEKGRETIRGKGVGSSGPKANPHCKPNTPVEKECPQKYHPLLGLRANRPTNGIQLDTNLRELWLSYGLAVSLSPPILNRFSRHALASPVRRILAVVGFPIASFCGMF